MKYCWDLNMNQRRHYHTRNWGVVGSPAYPSPIQLWVLPCKWILTMVTNQILQAAVECLCFAGGETWYEPSPWSLGGRWIHFPRDLYNIRLVVWNMFYLSRIDGNVILPTDFHIFHQPDIIQPCFFRIFQRGRLNHQPTMFFLGFPRNGMTINIHKPRSTT